MTRSGPAVVDTNVLLNASDPTRLLHESAQALLATDDRDLSVTPQVIREYLAVATRPVELNGLALLPGLAVANVRHFLSSMRLLDETGVAVDRLCDVVADGRAAGRQVHDANIVATALAHGASAIVTSDSRHFARFADVIEIEALA